MSEWWTYRPSDFLMFSSRVYYRQIESFNADHSPLQLALFALGCYVLFACWSQRKSHIRVSFILLSGLWAFVSLDYFSAYLLTIHWGVSYVVYGFLLQAFLLLVRSIFVSATHPSPVTLVRWAGIALIAGGLAIYPCLALLSGRGYHAAEVIGAMPTPTAIVTVGFLLAARPQRIDLILLVIPVLWCLLDAITIATMRQPDWWVSPTMLIVAISISALFVVFSRKEQKSAP